MSHGETIPLLGTFCRRVLEKHSSHTKLVDMPDILTADSLRSVMPLVSPAFVALEIILSLEDYLLVRQL